MVITQTYSFMMFFKYGFLVLGLVGGFQAETAGAGAGDGGGKCGFPAIYNFGDSNSDTGAINAALREVPPPNGESFFGNPAGRFCDGRLIIDIIAEKLKIPYLSPYLDSLDTNFRHGANFATGGSSIRPGGYSPFHLGIQISQFIRFKSRTVYLFKGKSKGVKRTMARPEEFSKALYAFDIGQNDLAYAFQQNLTEKEVRASIPDILSQLSQAMQKLYKEGARVFWVHNTGPIGCLPYSVIYQSKPNNLDKNGCVAYQNAVAVEFNQQLKEMISQLRIQLQDTKFTYVDMYSAKYALISDAIKQGFVDPMNFCCGSYYGYHIDCGKKAVVNGTEYGNPCDHPSKHISWDGIHYSQAANLWAANWVLNGSFSDPPVSIQESCHHPKNA